MDNKETLLSDYDELADMLKEAVRAAGTDNGTTDIALLKQISTGMNVMESLARHNTFYVPYDSESGTRAIRLSVVENSENEGSFTVDTQLDDGSHVNVNARVDGDEISAYILSDGEVSGMLEGIEDSLKQLGFYKVKLSAVKAEQFPVPKNGENAGVETRKLFSAAKVFVENLR